MNQKIIQEVHREILQSLQHYRTVPHHLLHNKTLLLQLSLQNHVLMNKFKLILQNHVLGNIVKTIKKMFPKKEEEERNQINKLDLEDDNFFILVV
jgi:hypothetical protein